VNVFETQCTVYTSLKSAFSAQQFRRWQCGSIFIRLAVDPTPCHPNFGSVPLHQIANVGVNVSKYLQLFDREIIFEVF